MKTNDEREELRIWLKDRQCVVEMDPACTNMDEAFEIVHVDHRDYDLYMPVYGLTDREVSFLLNRIYDEERTP